MHHRYCRASIYICIHLYLIASSKHWILNEPTEDTTDLWILCTENQPARFTEMFCCSSHCGFALPRTEFVIIRALSHDEQTGERFHCLSYSDAISYPLQVCSSFLVSFLDPRGKCATDAGWNWNSCCLQELTVLRMCCECGEGLNGSRYAQIETAPWCCADI